MKFRTYGIWGGDEKRGVAMNEAGRWLVFSWRRQILYLCIWIPKAGGGSLFVKRWLRTPAPCPPPRWLVRFAQWLGVHHSRVKMAEGV